MCISWVPSMQFMHEHMKVFLAYILIKFSEEQNFLYANIIVYRYH